MDTTNSGPNSLSRQGSGNVGAQAEYDLHTVNNGFNTGSASSGMSLIWDDRSLSGIGIPGRIGRFQVGMNSYGEGGDGLAMNTDRKDFAAYLSLMPMSQVKNKWLSGFTFEYGAWFCNVDGRASATAGNANGCNRYRVQNRSPGAQALFDTGANTIGDGLHVAHGPGIVYSVGPYTFRTMGHWQTSADGSGAGTNVNLGNTRGHKQAHSFLIAHDLYVWSPKGWLTGSATEAGSVLAGQHFERVDMSLNCGQGSGLNCVTGGFGGHIAQFHRNRILLREWDLWYVIAPRMNVGINVLWYDAANLRNGQNFAAHNLGICNTPVTTANCRSGIGGDWVDVFLNLRWYF